MFAQCGVPELASNSDYSRQYDDATNTQSRTEEALVLQPCSSDITAVPHPSMLYSRVCHYNRSSGWTFL